MFFYEVISLKDLFRKIKPEKVVDILSYSILIKKKKYNQKNYTALMIIIDPFQKNLTNPKHLNGSVKILNSPNSVF